MSPDPFLTLCGIVYFDTRKDNRNVKQSGIKRFPNAIKEEAGRHPNHMKADPCFQQVKMKIGLSTSSSPSGRNQSPWPSA
mmetsp:Transcript_31952/g.123976  ORF Transcript_31952/g.123976 Transcript_31952/m.123976 type:complete len:80 (-) Transcript_31952:671-910(-)